MAEHSTDEELARDRARSDDLESEGFRIFCADNIDVYENIDGVLDTLPAFIRGEVS